MLNYVIISLLSFYFCFGYTIFGIWIGFALQDTEFQSFTKKDKFIGLVFLFLCAGFWPITLICAFIFRKS